MQNNKCQDETKDRQQSNSQTSKPTDPRVVPTPRDITNQAAIDAAKGIKDNKPRLELKQGKKK